MLCRTNVLHLRSQLNKFTYLTQFLWLCLFYITFYFVLYSVLVFTNTEWPFILLKKQLVSQEKIRAQQSNDCVGQNRGLTSEPSGRVACWRALILAYLTSIYFFPILGSFPRVLKDQVDFGYIPTVCILLYVIFLFFFDSYRKSLFTTALTHSFWL